MFRLLCLLAVFCGPLAHAQIPLVVEQVSPHVWTARPARTPRINATSTVIVGETGLTVVESQADPALARQLIREIRSRISKKPVRTLIFTHAHLDHILGAQAFQEAYPNLNLVAHENTRAAIANEAEKEREQWLAFLQGSAAKMDRADKQYAELQAYIAAVRGARILAPTQTFSDAMTLHDGITMHLQFLGRGHTDGDIVVSIPADRVIVTGDLVHDLEPLFQNSHPRDWLTSLRALQALSFDILIGGHGDAHRGAAILESWIRFVELLIAEIETARLRNQSLEDARAEIESNLLQWLAADGTGARIQHMREALMTEWIIGPIEGAIRNSVETAWKRL